jgi:hypothetical protein
MRILFDNATPRGIAAAMTVQTVEEARSRGWDGLTNGAPLEAAEAGGFDVLLTTDRNLPSKQNLAGRRLAVVSGR